MKFYCLAPVTHTSFFKRDCADVSSWDYFWFPGNIASAVPSILGLFEPLAVSVVSLFWLYPLFYTHRHRRLVCSQAPSHCRINTGLPPNYIYDSNYFETAGAHCHFKRTGQYKCIQPLCYCRMQNGSPPSLPPMPLDNV